MKRFSVVLLAVALTFALFLSGCAPQTAPAPEVQAPEPVPAPEPPIELTAGIFFAEGTAGLDAMRTLLRNVEERSNGRVRFTVHAGGTLVSMADSLSALREGVMDISPLNISFHLDEMKMSGLTAMPGLGVNVKQTNSAQLAMAEFPPIRDELERLGLVFWTSLTSDKDIIFSNKPIRTLEDFRGLKIHASGEMARILSHFGAAPVSVPLPEMYEALERGTIDAVIFPREPGIGRRFYETVDYVVYGQFGLRGQAIYINAESWAALPQDIQDIFKEAGEEFVSLHADMLEGRPAVRDFHKTLDELGVTPITLSDECNQIFNNAANSVVMRSWVDRKEQEGYPGQEVLDRYLDLLSQYRN